MTEAKHTPTPWEAHQCGVYRKQLRKPGDPWENPIACTGDDPDPELGETASERQQIADAAFIVRAVNAHDAMLAALKDAFTNCYGCGGHGYTHTHPDETEVGATPGSSRIECPVCPTWRTAIAKAEGGAS